MTHDMLDIQPTSLAAYYFPQYHSDPRNDRIHGEGWTEWKILRECKPRFEGHEQPKAPLWGEEDESDSEVAVKKIRAAADHGIEAFIVDWYWYDGEPFLAGALERGLLGASNSDLLRYAIMWANHDWLDLYPAPKRGQIRLLPAPNARYSFDAGIDYIVGQYLGDPRYWKVEGRPYLSIYDTEGLIKGMGDIAFARRALDRARNLARDAVGLDVHINLALAGDLAESPSIVEELAPDSVTHYTWLDHKDNGFTGFPTSAYSSAYAKAQQAWHETRRAFTAPYIPNVTMGWDPSPRTEFWEHDLERDYPYTSILSGNTDELFKEALLGAMKFVSNDRHRIVTINAWNEWTEGSYLEPDRTHGAAYLEAVREACHLANNA